MICLMKITRMYAWKMKSNNKQPYNCITPQVIKNIIWIISLVIYSWIITALREINLGINENKKINKHTKWMEK